MPVLGVITGVAATGGTVPVNINGFEPTNTVPFKTLFGVLLSSVKYFVNAVLYPKLEFGFQTTWAAAPVDKVIEITYVPFAPCTNGIGLVIVDPFIHPFRMPYAVPAGRMPVARLHNGPKPFVLSQAYQ